MADLFISYAAEDRGVALVLAKALDDVGWSIWWDRELITGQKFDEVIERELQAAKGVIVLWSRNSVVSELVRNEAGVAAERGVLLPANIDGTKLPLEFRRRQTADLKGWAGQTSHQGFVTLCTGISSLLGGDRLPADAAASGRARRRARPWRFIAPIALTLAIGAYFARTHLMTAPTVQDQPAAERLVAPVQAGAAASTVSGPAELADAIVGTYEGEIVADSKGSARSNITVHIAKLSANAVRVTSPYARFGTIDIQLTRSGENIVSAEGDTPLALNMASSPPSLSLNPRSELAFRGTLTRPVPK